MHSTRGYTGIRHITLWYSWRVKLVLCKNNRNGIFYPLKFIIRLAVRGIPRFSSPPVDKTSPKPCYDQWIPIMPQLLLVPMWIQVRHPVAQITEGAQSPMCRNQVDAVKVSFNLQFWLQCCKAIAMQCTLRLSGHLHCVQACRAYYV